MAFLQSDGPHTLTAKARDAAGNVGTSAPVDVIVDNTPPVVGLTGIVDGGTVSGKVNVVVTVADITLASVELAINGTVVRSASDGFTYNWNTAPYKKTNPNVLTVTAKDKAEHITVKTVRVTVK